MEIYIVPVIVAVVYGIIELYKLAVKGKADIYLKIIPAIAFVVGGIIGTLLFYFIPQIIMAESVWLAMVIGACSGLSATGCNQVFKQLKKVGIEVKDKDKDNE